MIRLRHGGSADLAFLLEMLFEAFYWDPSMQRPPFETFRANPEATMLLGDWGRHGDRAVIAEDDGQDAGAAWFRLWTPEQHSYGFVGPEIPELAIAIRPSHRSRKIGRQLLEKLIDEARATGFPAVSLSVSPANPARRLYEQLGFRKVGESGSSWTLLLDLGQRACQSFLR